MRLRPFLCLLFLFPTAVLAQITPVITAYTPTTPAKLTAKLTIDPFLSPGQDSAPLGFTGTLVAADHLCVNPSGQIAVIITVGGPQRGKNTHAVLLYTAGKPHIVLRDDEPIDHLNRKVRISSPQALHLSADGHLIFQAFLDLPHPRTPQPPAALLYWDGDKTQVLLDQTEPPKKYDPSLSTTTQGIGPITAAIGENGFVAAAFYLDKATPQMSGFANDPHPLLLFDKGALSKVISTLPAADEFPEMRFTEFAPSGGDILVNLTAIDPKYFRRVLARLVNHDLQIISMPGSSPKDVVFSLQITPSRRMLIHQAKTWTLTGPNFAHPETLFQDEQDPSNTPADRIPGEEFDTDVRLSDDGYILFWSRQTEIIEGPHKGSKLGIQLRLRTPQGEIVPLRMQDIPAYRTFLISRVAGMAIAPGGAVVITVETTNKKNLALLYHPDTGLRAFSTDDVPATGNAGSHLTISPNTPILTADAHWFFQWSASPTNAHNTGYNTIDLKNP